MDRVTAVSYCLGLLSLFLLLNVDGRSLFNPGECAKQHILFELECQMHATLRVLREDLELERKITANMVEGKSITRKRGEPCFWKYCV
uniref:Urotensin 2B n=1 Tax=Maylandia zebra TaxID=106582 RepID=A0A3P9B2M8_9CICH